MLPRFRPKFIFLYIVTMFCCPGAWAAKLFIPMDATSQTDHLKAYGVVFASLQQGMQPSWLLNYRGGSFVIDDNDKTIEQLCKERNVNYMTLRNKDYEKIEKEISDGGKTFSIVTLEKVPRIAVYTPTAKKPWDDAVTLALTYAQIPFDKLYADEVLNGALDKYDWLHLHHEDFTGQLGKYWLQYHNMDWYQVEQNTAQALAVKHGFNKISQLQLAVVKKIRDFVAKGGNLFAMCSATETFDIALAAEHTDICDAVFDGDPVDDDFQQRLDYTNCFAFTNFSVNPDPSIYEHSNIDNPFARMVPEDADTFILSVFPAQPDPVPAMLTQNHTTHIKGFMGQTNVFRKQKIKPGVLIMAGYPPAPGITLDNGQRQVNVYNMHDNEARYLHGEYEKGTWTFYSGHDPEDFQHMLGDPPTDLSLHPHSPGYRLILNNVLLHAVKRVVVPKVTSSDKLISTPVVASKPIAPLTIPENTSYNIYPTASNNQLNITVNHGNDIGTAKSNARIEHVVISNAAGKELINQTYNAESVTVDIKDLAPGMYMVRVNDTVAGKLMKE